MKHLILGLAALAMGAFVAGCSSGDDKEPGGNETGELSIEFFRANPAQIAPGSEAILSWKTKNATSIRILDQKNAKVGDSTQNEGSLTVKPEETTTYTLVAQNSTGAKKEQTLQLIVAEETGPEATFGATKTNMDYGTSTFLRWNTTDAVRVVIAEAGGGQVIVDTDRASDAKLLSGDKEVTPDRTTIYELVATDEKANSTTKAVEIVVDPVIASFGSDVARPIPIGTDVKLVWTTRGAEEVEITTPEGESYVAKDTERASGEATLKAGESGTFTLTATRGKGQKIQEYKAQMREYPVIETYEVSPGAINAGQPTQVTVSWKVANADTVRIDAEDGSSIVASTSELEGSKAFSTSATMKLTLTASNPAGDTTALVTLLAVARPEIVSFVANPNRVVPGATVHFDWSTTGASSLELEQTDEFGEVTTHPIGQAADGSKDIAVSVRSTFKLTARNLANATVDQSVSVDMGPPVVDDFAPTQARFAATDPVELTWTGRGGKSVKVYAIEGRAGNGTPINPVLVPGCDLEFPVVVSTGTCTVGPKSTNGRYQFQIVLADGTFKDEKFTTALVSDGPVIDRFEVSKTLVDEGESFQLVWLVARDPAGNPPELTLTVNGEDMGVPELTTKPEDGTATVQFATGGVKHIELTATSNGGATFADHAAVDVTVAGTPSIDSFTVTPGTIADGESVTFAWTTTNVTRASIVEVTTGQTIHSVPANKLASGSFPASPAGAPVLTYRLQGYNAKNVPVQADVTVTISSGGSIASFVVPASAMAGDTIQLDWTTSGGDVTLTSTRSGPPSPLTGAPMIDISATGTTVTTRQCGAGWSDEGCATITFPPTFTFPFDGSQRTAVEVFENGFLSFDVGLDPGDTWDVEPFPSAAFSFVHLSPLWGDLDSTYNLGGGIHYEFRNDPLLGDYLVVQWSHTTDLNVMDEYSSEPDLTFQAVLWPNGAVDFRYGTMDYDEWLGPIPDGSLETIGFQSTTGNMVDMLGSPTSPPAGGLQNKSWRYFEQAQAPQDSIQVTVDETTIFTLCVDTAAGRECQQHTVVVN